MIDMEKKREKFVFKMERSELLSRNYCTKKLGNERVNKNKIFDQNHEEHKRYINESLFRTLKHKQNADFIVSSTEIEQQRKICDELGTLSGLYHDNFDEVAVYCCE